MSPRTTRWLAVCVLATAMSSERAPAADPAGPAQAPSPACLNARDLGASGSSFQTVAVTSAGSRQITVADAGDFQPGQGVTISRCNIHYDRAMVLAPENTSRRVPLGDAGEIRGYEGRGGGWIVFLVEITGTNPLTIRWSDDLAKTWKRTKVPVTFDWQALGNGVEIKLKRQGWRPGNLITFHALDRLVTVIEAIQGKVLTLRDAPTGTVKDAVVRHCDDAALQAAIDRALAEKRNLFLPPGHYRLTQSLSITNPEGLTLEGASGVDTLLDISEGFGACIHLSGGTEVALRNLRMVGHTGLGEGPGWHPFVTTSGAICWPMALRRCRAVEIHDTTRVLVENCHASRMNCEAFYSEGRSRPGPPNPNAYTQAITYLRCSVTNSDSNAFNNNDLAENTSVLLCRIVDVGGCTWEGASMFVRFIGNYVRNAGPVAMGNIGTREALFEKVGSGQHIVADNVFEGRRFYDNHPGGFILHAMYGATQIIIRNNLFVNFNSSGVEISGMSGDRFLPAEYASITGNIFDMTCQDEKPLARTAVQVSASSVIVSDNQIYARGKPDPLLTGIRLAEPAVCLSLHDNMLRNCGCGLISSRAMSAVERIIDGRTFVARSRLGVPFPERRSHCYRGWNLVWLAEKKPVGSSIIDHFDPETCRFVLRDAYPAKIGQLFEVYPADGADWNIHDNTITGCLAPIVLDSYGSPTSLLRNNLVSRGEATGVAAAIEVRGCFSLVGNHVFGFDEQDSAALSLVADPLGRVRRSVYRQNLFEKCARTVREDQPGLWPAAPVQ